MLPISSQNIYAPGCHIALLTEGGPAPTPWSTNISLLTEGHGGPVAHVLTIRNKSYFFTATDTLTREG